MDELDKKILKELQEDASRPVAEIAERVGMSATPCWRRIKKLENEKVIRKRVALVDPSKIGAGVTVFVAIRAARHSDDWLDAFASAVSQMPEVIEFHRLSGDLDYLLKIVVPDIAGYDAVYKRLISAVDLSDVSASFVMEEIKSTTAIPLDYA